jgi:transcription antitermination protein NusB
VRRTDQRRAAVFLCYQRDVTGAPIEDLIGRSAAQPPVDSPDELQIPNGNATAFTRELVEGVEANRDELDDLIEQHAIGWHVERIAPLERAILRVALFEITHRPDVPDEVAVDEAVETAKLYCGSDTPAFINGILGGVLREVRSG